jgi:hypothetical protein
MYWELSSASFGDLINTSGPDPYAKDNQVGFGGDFDTGNVTLHIAAIAAFSGTGPTTISDAQLTAIFNSISA